MTRRVDCVGNWVSYVSCWMNWVSMWVCCLVDIVMSQMLSWVDSNWSDMCLMVDTVVM